MTAREFREVDHDLLADYVGGALDGTPEEATVARLVGSDPAWADAYATLAPAVARVSADLTGWGEPAPEMPLAVLDRLTAALAGAGPAVPAADEVPAAAAVTTDTTTTAHRSERRPGGTEAGDGTDAAAPGSPGRAGPAVVPTQATGPVRRTGGPSEARPDPTGPGRPRRRWTRLAGPVALAAASLAAVGLGVGQLVDRSTDDAADTTAAAPASGEAGASFRFTGDPERSGTDWTPQTLAGGSAAPRIASLAPNLQPGDGSTAGSEKQRWTAGGLDRLTDRSALGACLDEIAAAHARGPVTVDLVDYAAFEGEPALVVRFADPAGERWAWVSGAECGVPGSGADTRYRTRVG